MAKNIKGFRALTRLIEAGYNTEKAIASMTMTEMLALPGVSVSELVQFDELQKSVKAGKVVTYLGTTEQKEKKKEEGAAHDNTNDTVY
ncbi:hypothetical protein [Eubacterium callanderi]|uniref:hypothetical protein n=1 Tax=Eubacterium callanderi TaxID=53442 RepID=UPI001C11CE4D|nr:hypothetical protein [Eubacterium callanderi]MBU5306117.1 hypothetical protein [Eubacterium callanderi]